MPWLYYEKSLKNNDAERTVRNALTIINNSGKVKFRATFNPKYEDLTLGIVSNLKFKLAKFHIDGTFVGFEDLNN